MKVTENIATASEVINAAGKMTALGGSVPKRNVIDVMSDAASRHFDLQELRRLAGEYIAGVTGAEAACVTSGAAAGICIGVAAILSDNNFARAQMLPLYEGEKRFILQTGQAVNFGATIEQMIRIGGGVPELIGTSNSTSRILLSDRLKLDHCAGMIYVLSHHCVQDNMLSLQQCIDTCREFGIPLIVDAAAETDLTACISAGADLVTWSGGKAIGGPTSGFIAGTKNLIHSCEMQFQGIARPMKVGKEQILGLLKALENYVSRDVTEEKSRWDEINRFLVTRLQSIELINAQLRPDEAGRGISRVAVSATENCFNIRDLINFLREGHPSIRTRNHHIDQGIFQIDPREISLQQAEKIAEQIRKFSEQFRNKP